MFNFTLYKYSLRKNLFTLLIFAAVLTLYFSMVIPMFDPKLGGALKDFAESMPTIMAMFGMDTMATTMIGFISSWLYGFIMLVFPMVFSIICANGLVAGYVDKGSMTCLLAAPVKRGAVAFTQMKALASGIFLLTAYATGVGITVCNISFPGELDIKKFLLLNLGLLTLELFIGGVCFFCSCVFNETKYSIGLGAGISALSFILQMLANTDEKLEKIKYLTFFTLFDPGKLIAYDAAAIWSAVMLFIGSLLLFFSAILIFKRKDLPI